MFSQTNKYYSYDVLIWSSFAYHSYCLSKCTKVHNDTSIPVNYKTIMQNFRLNKHSAQVTLPDILTLSRSSSCGWSVDKNSWICCCIWEKSGDLINCNSFWTFGFYWNCAGLEMNQQQLCWVVFTGLYKINVKLWTWIMCLNSNHRDKTDGDIKSKSLSCRLC